MRMRDTIHKHTRCTIHKGYEKRNGIFVLEDIQIFEGNALLIEGANTFNQLLTGAGGTVFDNDHARVYVGNDAGEVDPDDSSGLGGGFSSSVDSAGMFSASYPDTSNDWRVAFQAYFNNNDSQFHWYEFGIANGDIAGIDSSGSTGVLLNRKTIDMGDKAADKAWMVTVELFWG